MLGPNGKYRYHTGRTFRSPIDCETTTATARRPPHCIRPEVMAQTLTAAATRASESGAISALDRADACAKAQESVAAPQLTGFGETILDRSSGGRLGLTI